MVRLLSVLLAIVFAGSTAHAGPTEDCAREEGNSAIAACGTLIEQNPEDAAAYVHRGNAYFGLGQFDPAAQDFTEAIAIDPADAEAYFERGRVYLETDNAEQAIADLSQAINLDPDHALAYNSRGVAYRRQGSYGPAIADFDKAIELQPKNPILFINRGYAYYLQISTLGRTEAEIAHDRDAALADIKTALSLGVEGDVKAAAEKAIKELSALGLGSSTSATNTAANDAAPAEPSQKMDFIPDLPGAPPPSQAATECGSGGKLVFGGGFVDFEDFWNLASDSDAPKAEPTSVSATVEPRHNFAAKTKVEFQDVEVCALFSVTSGKEAPYLFGLRFWPGNGTEYWALTVPATGRIEVNRVANGKTPEHVGGSLTDPSLLSATGENEIAVRLHGNTGVFVVNGRETIKFHREGDAGKGSIGFVMVPAGKEPVQFVMKAFQVRALAEALPQAVESELPTTGLEATEPSTESNPKKDSLPDIPGLPMPQPAAAPGWPAELVEAKNFADETTDWGVKEQSTLRSQKKIATRTPLSVPGARRITTRELQQVGPQSVLIDVLDDADAHITIPGAYFVPGAGNYGKGKFTDSLQKKFAKVLDELTQRDRDRQIVIFCYGSECWESYNAVLRAAKMGYRKVLWYRGGLDSWKTAELPLVQPAGTYPMK